MTLRERFLGCLVGCAVGDALGAPYEGLWSHAIPGDDVLLADFAEYEGYPKGQYTDDTQLSLATVESILEHDGISYHHIADSIARLWKNNSVIGPGGACTQAAWTFLRTGDWQTCGAAEGQAGNGTAMRTAVLGLSFVHEPNDLAAAAAAVSRITHRDRRSIAGGVAVAKAAQLLAQDRSADLCREIAVVVQPIDSAFAEHIRRLPALAGDEAIATIAWAGMSRPEFEQPIITPFVIPTVLAAFWCLLQEPSSWSKAVTRAIRLGGDVDTLGAIVGALAGVRDGVSAIPQHLVEGVVDSEQLQIVATRYHALVSRASALSTGDLRPKR